MNSRLSDKRCFVSYRLSAKECTKAGSENGRNCKHGAHDQSERE